MARFEKGDHVRIRPDTEGYSDDNYTGRILNILDGDDDYDYEIKLDNFESVDYFTEEEVTSL